MSYTVTQSYLDGISEGRALFAMVGMEGAPDALANAETMCRRFPAASPVGQMSRGERDFWRLKINKSKGVQS